MVLLLVMTVALGIGLSVITRTLTDVSTSTKVEQSSRAFSAAEAGIEQALKQNYSPVIFPNQSQATVNPPVELPLAGQGLEYPPVGKEETAHFWLANPNSPDNPPAAYYTAPSVDLYWGAPGLGGRDQAAIEVTLTHLAGGIFQSKKFFYDPVPGGIPPGRQENGFSDPAAIAGDGCLGYTITTSFGPNRNFFCRVNISFSGLGAPMILRARLLYTGISQPIALMPVGGASLPPQAEIYTSIGTSGSTQRTIQLFSLKKVVPFYMDYAIFSAGPINK
ncbi:MAG: Uncharacterized protein CEO21_430 [Microgenomates group bacterium Gr01-1014_80]|nr:MAG: Uncharacterized protein CEO21_430 [Microgenomates group bacterium Gr01-1014_80]